MNLAEFRRTRKWCTDLGRIQPDAYESGSGYVYLGQLIIEPWDDRYLLVIGNAQHGGSLPALEEILYEFAKGEGYFEELTS